MSLDSRSPRLGIVALGVVSVLALLVNTACGTEKEVGAAVGETIERSPQTPIVIPPGEPIVIGVSVPLTGPDEVLGIEDRDAVVVAVERWKAANGSRIKGHDIQVRAADDGCTEAEITVRAAERLLRQEGLVGVIGPDCSAGAQAAIPVYAKAGIVAISGSATRSDLTTSQPESRLFFRTAYRNDLEGALAGLFVSSELGARKVYLVDDGELYGRDLADATQKVLEENRVIVTRESVQRGTVDFSELVARIVQEKPEFVGFAGFNPEAVFLFRQLRDAGYDGLFGAGDAAASVHTFVEPVGPEAAQGVLFAGCSLTLPEDFVADFQDLHGHRGTDSAFVAQYADAVTILLDAVAQVAEERRDSSLVIDPMALRDAVRSTTLEEGVSGPITFDANGDRVPSGIDSVSEFIDAAIAAGDVDAFVDLGLVPCQVQDGHLVNLLGPGTQPLR